MLNTSALRLSAEGMTVEELREEWIRLEDRRDEVGDMCDGLRGECDRASEPEVRERLLIEVENFNRHYMVLCAWTELFHSASVFAEYGCESVFLTDELTAIEVIGLSS